MISLLKLNLLKLNLPKLDPRSLAQRKRKARSALLGLAFDGHRLEAVVVRRSNGSLRIENTFATPLELNLLTDDPELVGREIRNRLNHAGIRERYCAVCLPLDWALTLHTPIPDLPPEDEESFLNIEAERGFPFGQDTLSVVNSRCRGRDGSQFATLLAIPKEHLVTLQKVLKAAQLRPLSFSLGLPALQQPGPASTAGLVTLGVSENNLELQITCGGGIAALRTLPGAMEQDGARKRPYADVVARDLRITLGQLSAELRETVQNLRVFGNGDGFQRFFEELTSRAKLLNLDVERVRNYAPDEFENRLPADATVSPALSLAARVLTGKSPDLEFLPPKTSAWKQLTDRYSSRKLVSTGVAAGAVVVLVALAFAIQQWQLSRWGTRWTAIKPRVTELETMQQQIRRYRPWFDESFRSLSILRCLTESFPEDGSVSAKSIEIREPGLVTCSGTARDNQALQSMFEKLSARPEVSSLQRGQLRGKSPMQFTFTFQWSPGGSHER